jgi:S-adenosylmethionine hydrolase
MIVLFTDFGPAGPYVGQLHGVLADQAPGVPIIDLMSDAPPCDPTSGAYLLAALAEGFPAGAVFLAVVDPGVGSDRAALALSAGGRWYVGPDNGLLAPLAKRDATAEAWEITWRPEVLSASFHGRDLFAPVAAMLARGEAPPGRRVVPGTTGRLPIVGADWPDDLGRIVYVDVFGNAMTGLRAAGLAAEARLVAAGQHLPRARTFSDLPAGEAFWYANANGLAEIAVNRGSAARELGLAPGSPVRVQAPEAPAG